MGWRTVFVLGLIFFAGCASGCIPATYISVPAIHGRVLDEEGRGIDGAKVQMVYQYGGKVVATLTTDNAGKFFRSEESRFFFYILSEDLWFPRYLVMVTVGDRQSEAVKVSGGMRMPWEGGMSSTGMDLGDMKVR